MIEVRKASTRGHTRLSWLDSWHTFSFGSYYDPTHMGIGALRVINDDTVAPGEGFGRHGHKDMEIVTYVLDGALEHRDSLGNKGIIRAGEVQRMRAGTGIEHSEFNASSSEPVHFLQIWIHPDTNGLEPGYEQVTLPASSSNDGFRLIASVTPKSNAVTVHQDIELHAASLPAERAADLAIAPDRRAYLHVARGEARLKGYPLHQGDGALLTHESGLHVESSTGGEVLVFTLH